MAQHIDVMISSTARDLPAHRKEAMDACVRQGMYPIMMEHLPASDADAIAASLKMVDDAEIYLGIFAHRYGYVPSAHDISITEMEYNRAVERGLPRLIFLMHDDHPIKAADMETGDGANKLKVFKDRLQTEQVVNFFKSPEDLRAHVINSLSHYRQRDATAFHYVSDIVQPPEPFIAHPYTLLQTGRVIGRQKELALLTEWARQSDAPVFNFIVAIGGMGKSALTWKWFNDVAPEVMKPLAGRMWWSFYESDATFENFVIRALAYVSMKPSSEIEALAPSERETRLLTILDKEPFLLVWDGLERIMIAYARMDAARMADDDLDEKTGNFVTALGRLPNHTAQAFQSKHQLRKTADPRIGAFLRRLTQVKRSRVLVSTRLYPAELQSVTGQPALGSSAYFLHGLEDEDATSLWQALGVSGSRETLLPLFHAFENYPLLIRALAGEVASYRRAPGNFDAWRKANPEFDPFAVPLMQVKAHVLTFSLRGLNDQALRLLQTIAALHMPANYDALASVMVGDSKPFTSENDFDTCLSELEDRGLLGWDRRANRYDLHPVVRGVVWSLVDDDTKREVYAALQAHFESIPRVRSNEVRSVDDLIPAIELYNTLIGLAHFEDAYRLFNDRLRMNLHFRIGAGRQQVELLEMLFPDGLDKRPRLASTSQQAMTFNALAMAYNQIGQVGKAVELFRSAIDLLQRQTAEVDSGALLGNLSNTLRHTGALHEAEAAAIMALKSERKVHGSVGEARMSLWYGMTLWTRGMNAAATKVLRNAIPVLFNEGFMQSVVVFDYILAWLALEESDLASATELLKEATEMHKLIPVEADVVRLEELRGDLAMASGDLATADAHLHQALIGARKANLVEDELRVLIHMADLSRQMGDLDKARDLLSDTWESAERGPYPLLHVDALNTLVKVENDVGNLQPAIEAATEAYRKAWCDGPPFAYHWGLELARTHLKELNAPEPELPPFEESKYDPMPLIDIDPPDEAGPRHG